MAKITNEEILPFQRDNTCAITWNNKVYIFGGVDENGDCVDSVYEYDPSIPSYTGTAFTLPVALKGMCGCACENYIYLFGGKDDNDDNNFNIYSFDLTNGVVNTTKAVSLPPITATFDSATMGIYLLNKSSDYEVVNLDSNYDITTISFYTDGDYKLGSAYNTTNLKYYIVWKSGGIYLYEFNGSTIGNLVKSISVNINMGYVYSIYSYNGIDEYIIFGKSNSSSSSWWIYKCNFETGKVLRQYTLESAFNNYDRFSVASGIVYNVIYLVGGYNRLTSSALDVFYAINFNYYEVYVNYNSSYISVTPVNNVPSGFRYTALLQEIKVNDASTYITVNHVYMDNVDIKGNTGVVTGTPTKTRITINKVTSDIYIDTSYSRNYSITLIKSDGISFTGGEIWNQNTTYSGTFTIATGFEIVYLTINDYLGNDIKSTVYDEATKTITLPSGSWHTYRNVYIKIIAETPNVKITLYQNTSNDKTVNKNLIDIKTVTGIIKDECNILNPSVLIDVSGEGNYTLQTNYVYIDLLQRYYFIRSIDFVRKNLWRLNLHVDVLMSYKDKISSLSCLIKRNENTYNNMIPDGEMILSPEPIIQIEEIPNNIFKLDSGVEKNILITTLE